MSKIYEALRKAQNMDRSGGRRPDVLIPLETLADPQFLDMEEEMLGLYKVLEALFGESSRGKVIQFVACREGEGTSTVAREFSKVAANRIGKAVLLLDADRQQPSQHHYFSIRTQYSWIDALEGGGKIGRSLQRVGKTPLFVGPSRNSSMHTPQIYDSPRINDFYSLLKGKFDLVVVDSPPLTASPDALAIASRADGVVLVLEAEKTRWQTAKNVIEQIARVGGQLAGIALNKRRYYIPSFLYKYL